MLMKANKFLFEQDFRAPDGGPKNAAALQAAEERGHARGLAEGRKQAAAEADTQMANAMRRLADAAVSLLSGMDAHHARLEDEAIAFATALGRKLAGAAQQPRSIRASARRSAPRRARQRHA